MNQRNLTREKIRWGIVGPGKIAEKFAQDIRHTSNAELIAVASRTYKNAKDFAAKYDLDKPFGSYEDLYADTGIDAVYVATPHPFHLKNSSDALKAGKAVLCEKPLTTNPSECNELLNVSKSCHKYLMEGMWTYFLPAIRKIVEWIGEGKIGQIRHISSEFGFYLPYDPKHRAYNRKLGGGSLLDIGVYCLALNRLIFTGNPEKFLVSASLTPENVDSDLLAMVEYPGSTAIFHCSFLLKLPNFAYITGEHGYIKVPDFWRASECFLYQNDKMTEHFKDERLSTGFDFEIEAVSKDILDNKTESDLMPHHLSMSLQEQMAAILKLTNSFKP